MEREIVTESKNLEYPKCKDFPFNKVYFGMPTKMDDNSFNLDRPLFVTPYKSIASIFAVSRSPLIRSRLHGNYNLGYDEWVKPKTDHYLNELHIRVERSNMKFDEFELDLTGYVYEIDVSKLKDYIFNGPYGQDGLEYVIKGLDKVEFSDKHEVNIKTHVRVDNSPEHIQESKKSKYDDKYDLDQDQNTSIEPVNIDVDGVQDSMHDMYGDDAAAVADWLESKCANILRKYKVDKIDEIKKNTRFKIGRTEYHLTADSKIKSYDQILRSIVEGCAYILYKEQETNSLDDIKHLAHVSYKKYIIYPILTAMCSFEESLIDNIYPDARIHFGYVNQHKENLNAEGNCCIMITNKNKNSKIRVKIGDDLNDVIKLINGGENVMKQESTFLTASHDFIQESLINKKNLKRDIDISRENNRLENGYYSYIATASKDLEHIYKTLFKRSKLEDVVEAMDSLINDMRERREEYFDKVNNSEMKRDSKYQGLKKIIDQDLETIENNIEMLRDPEYTKNKKALVKKTIKMINNLQQDMITECERSQPTIIRGTKEIAKKLWMFENYTDDDTFNDDIIIEESFDEAILAKVGQMMVKLNKQRELQDLAEKNGVQITGMRYTQDRIMDIITSTVALMLARNTGDPKYSRLVEQGMQKRALKTEIINAYKDQANALINQYTTGSTPAVIVVKPDVEVISDQDEEYTEEFYVDENGEMKYRMVLVTESKKDSDDADTDDDDKHRGSEKFGTYDEKDLKWEAKPGEKIGKIKFGDSINKTRSKMTNLFGIPKSSSDTEDDFGYFSIKYENGKAASVTVKKEDISIELDRSIVFPGSSDNIKKKALDLKDTNGKLVSKVMSVEVDVNSDGTVKEITFTRAHYFNDKEYEVFESVSELMNRGKDEDDAIKFMKELYKFLDDKKLLTTDGENERKSINASTALNTNELKERGIDFMKQYYDKCKNCSHKDIYKQLEIYYSQFNNGTK